MSRQEIIDKLFNRTISKTFLVFITSTIALFSHYVDGWQWIIISTAYIGSTKYTETILKLKDKM
jgi:hypothetical protein